MGTNIAQILPLSYILRYCKNLGSVELLKMRVITVHFSMTACKIAKVGRNFKYSSVHNIFKTKMNKGKCVFTG